MMGKNLMPLIAGAGLAALTAGAATPAITGALSGGAAAGAGTAGAVGATDALASAGATGLLGGAGAEAAGYGGGLLAGGMAPIAESAATEIAPMAQEVNGATQTAFGPNGEYFGNSITDGTGMTANSYTGGFDNLSGIDRLGQRLGGMLDGGNSNNLSKAFKFSQNGQQPQQQAPAGGVPRPMQSQPSEPMRSPYDLPITQEEMYRKMYGGY